jgi:hypothetical protein
MALPNQFCWQEQFPFGADWNPISNGGQGSPPGSNQIDLRGVRR